MILSNKSSVAAMTLVETAIAACTSAMFLGSLFTMNMTAMKTVQTARQAAYASQVLQQRIESLRIANWHEVTDPNWVVTNLMNADAPGTDRLQQTTETLTLIPYGSSTSGNTKIVRTGGRTTVANRCSALLQESAMKVVWTVAYTGGINSQPITRQTVAILAKGGVAKW